MKARLLTIVLLAATPGDQLFAQGVAAVELGFGIDLEAPAWAETDWHSEIASIYEAWRGYLLADPHLQSPTTAWSPEEQERWPGYDLTASMAYVGVRATVLDIRPAVHGGSDEFLVQTLFASRGGAEATIRPVALTRVVASRQGDDWVFSSFLSHFTRGWAAERVGPIQYRFPPGYPFDRGRAERAVAFADSLATVLDLPPLEDVSYFVAASPQEILRAMGVEWTFGGQGYGMAFPWNRLVLSGDPEFGEENRHELTHMVIGPVLATGRVHRLVNEGLATWLGGSMGKKSPDVSRTYAAYLRDHPEVNLDSVLAGGGPDRGIAPAGAILVEMVHQARGIEGVKALLSSGRSDEDLKDALESLLDADWPEISSRWQQTALARGGATDHPPELP